MNKNILGILLAVLTILIIISVIGPVFMPGHYSHGPISFLERFTGPGHFWGSGMFIFPLFMLVVVLVIIYMIFGRGDFRPPWQSSDQYSKSGGASETALDILKKRYARSEISKEEFEQMKKDLE
jgi:putative membrane protein